MSSEEEQKQKRKRCGEAAMRRLGGNDVSAPLAADAKKDNDDEIQVIGVKEGPETKRSRPSSYWSCAHCTLRNEEERTVCEACGKQKGSVPVPPPVLDRINVTTLNVSKFEKSHSAPPGFEGHLEIFGEELGRDNPDIICLQEGVDCGDAFYENLLPGYVCLGRALSHAGLAMLFIKDEWADHATPIQVDHSLVDPTQTFIPIPVRKHPAVLARLHFSGGVTIIIGSCHLAPFANGAPARLETMQEMLSHVGPGDKLLIAGDFNMRVAEDSSFEALGLVDAWKEDGRVESKKITYNSFRNKFNPPSPIFRNSQGRYDRIYLRGFSVTRFDLFANDPLTENRAHFLSDHYGLRATLQADNGQDEDDF